MRHRRVAIALTTVALLHLAGVLTSCARNASVPPAEFVSAYAQQAQSVVAAVQKVESNAEIMTSKSSDTSAWASFDAILRDAQSTFGTVNAALLHALTPKGVESSGTEMWSATDELNTAVQAALRYVDGRQPAQLRDYQKHWETGRSWWNQAVSPIWRAAGETAPTIPEADRADGQQVTFPQ